MFPPVNISFTNDRYLRQSHRRRNPRSVSSDPRNNFATLSFPRPFPLCSPPTNFSTFRILAFLKSYTGPPPLPADISLAMPQQQDNWTQLIQIWSQTLQEDEDELTPSSGQLAPLGVVTQTTLGAMEAMIQMQCQPSTVFHRRQTRGSIQRMTAAMSCHQTELRS
jgi:hypothetical protein